MPGEPEPVKMPPLAPTCRLSSCKTNILQSFLKNTAIRRKLEGAFLLLFIAFSSALFFLDIDLSFESRVFFIAFNLLFCAFVALFAAYIAARSYVIVGDISLIFLGTSMLDWGMANGLTGLFGSDINELMMIHNMGSVIAGCFALAAAFSLLASQGKLRFPQKVSDIGLGLSYVGSGLLLLFIGWMANEGLIPPFMVEDRMTLWRKIVLGCAVFEFSASALIFRSLFFRTKNILFGRYFFGFIWLGLGLLCSLLGAPGTLLNWAGMLGQFVGGLYMLIALVNLKVESGDNNITTVAFLRDYKLLFENMSEGFAMHEVVYDRQGKVIDSRFLDVNPSFERLMGQRRSEVVGRLFSKVVPLLSPEERHACFRVAETGEPTHMESFSRKVSRWFEFFIFSPGAGRFAVIFNDITGRKKAEEVMERDKETLARLVEEQARELLEAGLALEKEKRLSDIGVLAATVAHELRNPLAVIAVAADNMKKKGFQELAGHLDNIGKKIDESNRIINNLLYYSSIKPPNLENIPLLATLDESLDSIYQSRKRGVIIQKDLDVLKGVLIEADHFQLKEVFHNVLDNAYDAVSEKNGRINIKAEDKDDAVDIFIKDNGIGIEEEFLGRVFDPFFTTKAKGTGLGLSVSKQILALHNASIYIDSKPGQGTCVKICLPKNRK